MNRFSRVAAAGAALMLCASPCMAAEDFRDLGVGERRSATFAGANVRLELGKKVTTPTARLQLAMTHSYENRQSAAPARKFGGRGLELGLTQAKQAALFLNGQEARKPEKKLGIGGTTTTLLVIGGVVAAVFALGALGAFDGDNKVILP